MTCNRMDEKSQSVPPDAVIESIAIKYNEVLIASEIESFLEVVIMK